MSIFRRRGRFGDVIQRQLDLFEHDHLDVIEEVVDRMAAYNRADRDEAEELYGDYVDAVETATELLADEDALRGARAGAQRARTELTWDAAAESHLALYRELA